MLIDLIAPFIFGRFVLSWPFLVRAMQSEELIEIQRFNARHPTLRAVCQLEECLLHECELLAPDAEIRSEDFYFNISLISMVVCCFKRFGNTVFRVGNVHISAVHRRNVSLNAIWMPWQRLQRRRSHVMRLNCTTLNGKIVGSLPSSMHVLCVFTHICGLPRVHQAST